MDLGTSGARGVIALPRVAEEHKGAVALVHFLLIAMEGTVRVTSGIGRSAFSHVVSNFCIFLEIDPFNFRFNVPCSLMLL